MLGFLKLQGTTCGVVIQKVPTTYAQVSVYKWVNITVIINHIRLLKASIYTLNFSQNTHINIIHILSKTVIVNFMNNLLLYAHYIYLACV